MTQPLGFGILGAGLVAPFHARSIRDARGARLVSVCDVNGERARNLAAEFGARSCERIEDLLADPAVAVVNVVTPNHLHYDAVLRCAGAGKHVITEKPPAMSLRETDTMIRACADANVKFTCTVQCRVRAAVRCVRRAIGQGRFGRLLHADAYMKWYRSEQYYHSDPWRSSRRSGAGVTVQHAFHYIDLLQHLAGPVRRVHARMTNLSHPSVDLEDTLLAFLDYANGAQGVVQASTALWPGTDLRIEINGTDGTAVITGERITTWQFKEPLPEDSEIVKTGDASQATAAGGPADFGHADHQAVIQDMIDAVREDRAVAIPVASVRPTLEIVLALYKSAAAHAPVDLPVEDDESIWGG